MSTDRCGVFNYCMAGKKLDTAASSRKNYKAKCLRMDCSQSDIYFNCFNLNSTRFTPKSVSDYNQHIQTKFKTYRRK